MMAWTAEDFFGGVAHPAQEALRYLMRGWVPVLLCWPARGGACACGGMHADGGKAPLLPDYQNKRPTAADVGFWWQERPHANLGVLLEASGLLVLDFDTTEGKQEALSYGLPATLVSKTAKGEHWYYKRPDNFPVVRRIKQGVSKGLDMLTRGYVVAPPSLHRTGCRYQWVGGVDAFERGVGALPEPPQWVWQLLPAHMQPKPKDHWYAPQSAMRDGGKQGAGAYVGRVNDAEEVLLRRALDHIPSDEYDTWYKVGIALSRWDGSGNGMGRGFELWDLWSRGTPAKYPGRRAMEAKWRSFGSVGGINVGTVFALAKEGGFDRKEEGKRMRETRRAEERIDPAKDARLARNSAPAPQSGPGTWFKGL